MRIILLEPRGFCAGVNRAVQSLDLALSRFGPPVYVYHEIVHNRWVVDEFLKKGAVFVESLDKVPSGSVLLYSAHGVSPAVRAESEAQGLRAIDATCPLVTKVHAEAIRLAGEGRTVFLIGHEGHDEVVGTMGEAPDAIILVRSEQDVENLSEPPTERTAYLTQTTLSIIDARRIVKRLESRFPGIVGPPTQDICYATYNRQTAVRQIAPEADVVLVVGSRNSSNSKRLAEIARECGSQAYLVDGPDDIVYERFSQGDTVVVTAGASAPEYVVGACVDKLIARFESTVETRRTCEEEEMRFKLPEMGPRGPRTSAREKEDGS